MRERNFLLGALIVADAIMAGSVMKDAVVSSIKLMLNSSCEIHTFYLEKCNSK